MSRMLMIGDLAAATGTKVNTIRFYEEIGLMRRAARTQSGRRTYGADDLERESRNQTRDWPQEGTRRAEKSRKSSQKNKISRDNSLEQRSRNPEGFSRKDAKAQRKRKKLSQETTTWEDGSTEQMSWVGSARRGTPESSHKGAMREQSQSS